MQPDAPLRLGTVTLGPANAGLSHQFEAAEAGIREAAAAGATLVLLPELFGLPYVFGDDPDHWRHLAEPMTGPTVTWAAALAQSRGIAIVFGAAIAADAAAKPANLALLASADGSCRCVAAKIHLPPTADGDRYGEADHFLAGPPSIESFTLGPHRLAALVCYDRRFPECWRAAAAAGAEIVLVLVAGPASEPEGQFLAELRTHARSNAVYALSSARTGIETVTGLPVRHDGLSAAIGPDGAVLALGRGEPGEALCLDINAGLLAEARSTNPTASRLRLASHR